ncbi:hypothetical protein DFJ73DRAFT_771499 [Zopfochytrium polystomum]|nr:hypothetical protein DFJ73DRAFT_771499 [Zopfochytrium polystomum]
MPCSKLIKQASSLVDEQRKFVSFEAEYGITAKPKLLDWLWRLCASICYPAKRDISQKEHWRAPTVHASRLQQQVRSRKLGTASGFNDERGFVLAASRGFVWEMAAEGKWTVAVAKRQTRCLNGTNGEGGMIGVQTNTWRRREKRPSPVPPHRTILPAKRKPGWQRLTARAVGAVGFSAPKSAGSNEVVTANAPVSFHHNPFLFESCVTWLLNQRELLPQNVAKGKSEARASKGGSAVPLVTAGCSLAPKTLCDWKKVMEICDSKGRRASDFDCKIRRAEVQVEEKTATFVSTWNRRRFTPMMRVIIGEVRIFVTRVCVAASLTGGKKKGRSAKGVTFKSSGSSSSSGSSIRDRTMNPTLAQQGVRQRRLVVLQQATVLASQKCTDVLSKANSTMVLSEERRDEGETLREKGVRESYGLFSISLVSFHRPL